MSRPDENIQNEMWNRLRKAHQPVTIYLRNGIRLAKVTVESFDLYAVAVRHAGNLTLVCKSSIATVLPEERKEKTFSHSPKRETAPAQTHIPASAEPPRTSTVVIKKRTIRRIPENQG